MNNKSLRTMLRECPQLGKQEEENQGEKAKAVGFGQQCQIIKMKMRTRKSIRVLGWFQEGDCRQHKGDWSQDCRLRRIMIFSRYFTQSKRVMV